MAARAARAGLWPWSGRSKSHFKQQSQCRASLEAPAHNQADVRPIKKQEATESSAKQSLQTLPALQTCSLLTGSSPALHKMLRNWLRWFGLKRHSTLDQQVKGKHGGSAPLQARGLSYSPSTFHHRLFCDKRNHRLTSFDVRQSA